MLAAIPTTISASVGGVIWPEDGRTVNELVRRADAAMYQDKAGHRRPAPADADALAPEHA